MMMTFKDKRFLKQEPHYFRVHSVIVRQYVAV